MRTKLQIITNFFQNISIIIMAVYLFVLLSGMIIGFISGRDTGFGMMAFAIYLVPAFFIVFPIMIVLTIAEKIQRNNKIK